MATLALGALGAAAGSAFLPTGLSILGIGLSGATLGSQLGSLVGAQIDQALLGASASRRAVDGPRLKDLHVTASTEGAVVPRLYGRARLGGQIIWATALEEEAVSRDAGGSGKGNRSSAVAGNDYVYYANFAVALCEGPISALGRVWADGREIDITAYTTRLYRGDEIQAPDPLVVDRQGGSAPAYLGLAYIVFERLPLAPFGNRIPQLSFEVSRSVDDLERDLRGVVLIPGSGEFVYAQTPVARTVGRIGKVAENVHTTLAATDWQASLDQLQATLPNVASVSFVVSWFGTDLRAAACRIEPRVESTSKVTAPDVWSVAGLNRATAEAVSFSNGRPAYGGTPSDQTVVDAVRDLRARGLSVVFSPFILMDVPDGNTLPDPASSALTQPAYPWRGRITVFPAPGQAGTADKTPAAAAQIAAFIGVATPNHFSLDGDRVVYTGPDEWSFRRFVLHNACLAKAAGGVDAFVLSSELRGLTTARDTTTNYPFVAALAALAADVRAILGPTTRITYGADWSEFFGHHPNDGSGDVFFHLDPLWSSPDIDCIGIDVYWPLADWRDGMAHIDAVTGTASAHDLTYLKSNLAAGEGFDWYYASDAARRAQIRTPITDDSAGKPWVFRYKDIRSWWSEPHHNRPGGVESFASTAWVPQSKPFWFLEIGCPAVDKGANQPNVFIDPKSSESFLPHFSSGARDDLMQRRVLQAFCEAFNPAHPGFVPALNPVSTLTGARMVDIGRIHAYAWDARPFPAFPNRTDTWGDGANWRLGHWINGRTASAPIPALVSTMLQDAGFMAFDATDLDGTIQGVVLDRVMSMREALQPIELAGFSDAVESDGRISFRRRKDRPVVATYDNADLVETRADAPLLRLTRGQETDLPMAAKIGFVDAGSDYAAAIAEARRGTAASARVSQAALGLVLDAADAGAIAESWLHEVWTARETARFVLPPSALAIEPGDVVALAIETTVRLFRVIDIGDHGAREIEAVAYDPGLYRFLPGPSRATPPARAPAFGSPYVVHLDIPPGDGFQAHAGLVAAAQTPWPGPVAVYRSPETSGYRLATQLPAPATLGITTSALAAGPVFRFDHANTLTVTLDRGALVSVSDLALFSGANTAAVEVAPDLWEILQFRTATLLAPMTYRLSGLLRGARGTDTEVQPSVAAGARFVLLDAAVRSNELARDEVGLPLHWRAGPARRDIGDPAYETIVKTFTGRGLRPRAPAHVRGARAASGDLTITWIRRTRTAGDSWATTEVPLGESSELYQVEILDGANVVRSFTVTAPRVTYTASEQTADFGSLQPIVIARISQIAPDFGPGNARATTV